MPEYAFLRRLREEHGIPLGPERDPAQPLDLDWDKVMAPIYAIGAPRRRLSISTRVFMFATMALGLWGAAALLT